MDEPGQRDASDDARPGSGTPRPAGRPRPRPTPSAVPSAPSLQKGGDGGRHRVADDTAPTAGTAPRPRPGRVIATAPAPDPADAAMTRFIEASESQPGDDEPDEPSRWQRVRRNRWYGTAVRTVVVLGVAAIVAALLRIYVVEPFYIPSESMEPTLHGCTGCTEDHVLVDKISYRFQDVHAGDVVVFHKPPDADVSDSVLIKRVIALGGDTLQLRKNAQGQWDGKVYVNGLALDESYVNPKCGSRPTVPLTATTTWHIPDGDVFVMGDNRCESEDSRAFGPIRTSSIIGKAVFIVWPLSRFGPIH